MLFRLPLHLYCGGNVGKRQIDRLAGRPLFRFLRADFRPAGKRKISRRSVTRAAETCAALLINNGRLPHLRRLPANRGRRQPLSHAAKNKAGSLRNAARLYKKRLSDLSPAPIKRHTFFTAPPDTTTIKPHDNQTPTAIKTIAPHESSQ